jgi:hypothetical protein
MRRRALFQGIAGMVVVFCMTAVAQDKGYWRASSSTAQSITGDVALSDEKIAINLVTFTMAHIRALKPEEIMALFNPDDLAGTSGSLYRVSIPASRKFLKKNSLCGSEDTQWMVTYVSGRSMKIAFFSGEKPPVFTPAAIADSTDLCGTFSYTR